MKTKWSVLGSSEILNCNLISQMLEVVTHLPWTCYWGKLFKNQIDTPILQGQGQGLNPCALVDHMIWIRDLSNLFFQAYLVLNRLGNQNAKGFSGLLSIPDNWDQFKDCNILGPRETSSEGMPWKRSCSYRITEFQQVQIPKVASPKHDPFIIPNLFL